MQYLVPLSEEIQLIITEMKIFICLNSLIYVCMYVCMQYVYVCSMYVCSSGPYIAPAIFLLWEY
jgi:hypothetical protein